MGVGEMSREIFAGFLKQTLGHAANACKDGAIAFVCMDWRHLGELLEAGYAVFSELKNVCVWNKTNGGMGSFYRSKHEMVFVFKAGTATHTNTFGLGDTGRYRTNVRDYAGINALRAGRSEELAMHPTVKPVALVADAIRDCSRRDEIVLDPFGGSGSTLIAAEKAGRRARLIEFDPSYCDLIVRRFEQVTGKQALLRLPANPSRSWLRSGSQMSGRVNYEPSSQTSPISWLPGGIRKAAGQYAVQERRIRQPWWATARHLACACYKVGAQRDLPADQDSGR